MQIVISIQDIWRRYEEQSRALLNLGVEVEDVVKLAYGFAAISAQPNLPYVHGVTHQHGNDIITLARNLLIDRLPHDDRLPFSRQSGYGIGDQTVFHLVDVVGEISLMLVDAVVKQVGSWPMELRLYRFVGPDLVLYLREDHSEIVRHRIAQSRP